ncbi:MAG: recombinase family protein [Alphaproteobacteria bacterium]
MQSFVAYYRVSTKRQGQSGLGLEAQESAVARHVKSTGGNLVAEFKEVESGRKSDRPELEEAIAVARKTKSILVVAKLDRLSRDPEFLFRLQNSKLEFVCCDMPQADKFTIGIMIVMAQKERDDISRRTKSALAALKARGVKLGNPRIAEATKASLKSRSKSDKRRQEATRMFILREIIIKGRVSTHADIAECLNARGIETARGGKWHTTTVRRLIPMPVKEFAAKAA